MKSIVLVLMMDLPIKKQVFLDEYGGLNKWNNAKPALESTTLRESFHE